MTTPSAPEAPTPVRKNTLYLQVLVAIVIGILLGWLQPEIGEQMKPLGDAFIKLMRMLIAPIIFTTVVIGLAGMGDLRRAGRVGLKAVIYFEIATTVALVIGLIVVNLIAPGAGFHANAATLDASQVSAYTKAAQQTGVVSFLLHIIPDTFIGAFTSGEILQVLLIALLFGVALSRLGDHARPIMNLLHDVARVFFGIVGFVTKLAPIAAFGAMAFTVGKYGPHTLLKLGSLLLCVYITCALFIFVVLGLVARLAGFSLWKILKLIREELLIVLGTSSSESGLPGLMQKLESVGCSRPVVGIVVPSGYSFNLDGTCIYLTMAALFIAQATDTPLTLGAQLGLLAVLLITSKGAAGVTGSGFVTLAATLAATGHVPVAGLALILGVDRFMSEARAITNFIGNAVGTLVIARWDGEFDSAQASAILARPKQQR